MHTSDEDKSLKVKLSTVASYLSLCTNETVAEADVDLCVVHPE